MTGTGTPGDGAPTGTLVAQAGEQLAKAPEYDMDIDVDRIISEQRAIDRLIENVFVEGIHFGVIPGTSQDGKPARKVLLQPGAELACHLFRLRPEHTILAEIRNDRLISYRLLVKLVHIPSGAIVGEAVGSANSREKKYVNQTMAKMCPQCQKPAIQKGSEQYGGGWYCNKKKAGCGAKFKDGDNRIEEQEGQQVTDAIWDLDNTIFKIAFKRGLVSGTRAATGMSGRFEVDTEDDNQDDDLRGRRGSEPPPGARQQGTPASGQRDATPGPERTDQPADGQQVVKPGADAWPRIQDASKAAGLSMRQLYQLMKETVGKDKPSEFSVDDVDKILAKLKETQEQKAANP